MPEAEKSLPESDLGKLLYKYLMTPLPPLPQKDLGGLLEDIKRQLTPPDVDLKNLPQRPEWMKRYMIERGIDRTYPQPGEPGG